MIEADERDTIRCPFCHYQEIEVNPGNTVCPKCEVAFEIDDRGECVFVDTNNPRLPIEGIICSRCGLVQGEDIEHCIFCKTSLNNNPQ